MLGTNTLMGFIPTADAERARKFYVDTLGLEFVLDDQFALVLKSGANSIRVVRTGSFTPATYTILGWEVADMRGSVKELTAAGVSFLRFSYFEQDAAGIWTAPTGAMVAWFHDPDGNVLSLSQHP